MSDNLTTDSDKYVGLLSNQYSWVSFGIDLQLRTALHDIDELNILGTRNAYVSAIIFIYIEFLRQDNMSFNLEDLFQQIIDTEQQVQNRLARVAEGSDSEIACFLVYFLVPCYCG